MPVSHQFHPKKFGEHDIDVQIECCGVCGSDVHTITGGWGNGPLPICVGHEIVGHAVRVGSDVSTVKLGDRVGIGAQVWSCGRCTQCTEGDENYCPSMIDTYGTPYPLEVDPDGTISQGGFSSHIRVHEHWVLPIPEKIPSHIAAPMLCAGLTVWAPLTRAGIKPGKQVAIVGLGGLGHFGVLWASALGAEVTVISHSPQKELTARELGAKNFVLSTGEGWAKSYAYAFDIVLNTSNMTNEFNIPDYLSICRVGGIFHQVGLPNEALPKIMVFPLMKNASSITASHIGNRKECLAMLEFAAKYDITPMVETIPISEAGCADAVTRVSNNQVKYRFTLTDYDKAFRRFQ